MLMRVAQSQRLHDQSQRIVINSLRNGVLHFRQGQDTALAAQRERQKVAQPDGGVNPWPLHLHPLTLPRVQVLEAAAEENRLRDEKAAQLAEELQRTQEVRSRGVEGSTSGSLAWRGCREQTGTEGGKGGERESSCHLLGPWHARHPRDHRVMCGVWQAAATELHDAQAVAAAATEAAERLRVSTQAQVSHTQRAGRGALCAAWGLLPTALTAPDTKCPGRDAWLRCDHDGDNTPRL